MTTIEKVEEFMKVTQPVQVATEVTLPARERIKLRMQLIVEELYEYAESLDTPNMVDFCDVLREARNKMYKEMQSGKKGAKDTVKTLDAFLDLQYVLDGAIIEHGMQKIKESAFDEVHRSNMTKFCTSLEQAEANVKYYYDTEALEVKIEEHEGKWVLKNAKTDKVVKPKEYSPTDLKHYINGAL